MKVEKEVHEIWKKELDMANIYDHAKEIGSDVRTITNARKTGKCHKHVAKKINDYILRKRKERENNPLIQS